MFVYTELVKCTYGVVIHLMALYHFLWRFLMKIAQVYRFSFILSRES